MGMHVYCNWDDAAYWNFAPCPLPALAVIDDEYLAILPTHTEGSFIWHSLRCVVF